MLEKITNLPENVLGFSAKGTVTKEDYENTLIPAVEEVFHKQKKIRFLYHLGEDFSGIDAGAVWDDTLLGIKHISGWEKMALVSDVDWIRMGVKLFGLAIPGHVKVFHNSQYDQAVQWVAETTG